MICQWCNRQVATQQIGDDDYNVCATCAPKVLLYYQCIICGEMLSGFLGSHKRRLLERGVCRNDSCRKKYDVRMGLLCCEQAEYTHCVCARSYKCPVHGEKHVGTHD